MAWKKRQCKGTVSSVLIGKREVILWKECKVFLHVKVGEIQRVIVTGEF